MLLLMLRVIRKQCCPCHTLLQSKTADVPGCIARSGFAACKAWISLDALQGVELLHVKLGLIKVDRTAAQLQVSLLDRPSKQGQVVKLLFEDSMACVMQLVLLPTSASGTWQYRFVR